MRNLVWLIIALIGLATTRDAFAAPAFTLPPPVQPEPLAEGQTAQSVKFARAAFQLSDGAIWAYEGVSFSCSWVSSPIKWRASDWRLDTARMSAVFREEYGAAGFTKSRNMNLFEEGPTEDRYQLAALIIGMDARLCTDESGSTYSGRMRMTVEWQLYDNLRREVVQRVQTTAGGEERRYRSDGVESTLYAAFRGSVRALLASQDFRKTVTAAPPAATAATSTAPPLRFEAAAAGKRTIASSSDAVAAIFAGSGHGSGFLISHDGYLLTNHHVVGGAKFVKVRWSDGIETVGEVVRADRRRDIAIVKVDPGSRQPLAIRPQPPPPAKRCSPSARPSTPGFRGP